MQQDPTIPQPSQQANLDPTLTSPNFVTSNQPSDGWRSIASTIFILLAAPVIALLLINFVFQSYEVDGPSMETTLQNHDRLIVWKVPRTVARITHHHFIPKRGEIIVFIKRGLIDAGTAQDKQLIKRVIGLPGDRVVIDNGVITVYNAQHPSGYNPDTSSSYGSVIQATTGNVDLIVPPGELFVCGDNRVNSLDSRIFGTISSNDVVGELVLRIFPVNKAEAF